MPSPPIQRGSSIGHDLLAAHRMHQRRLQPVGQRAQQFGGAAAAGAAHDDDAAGLVDAAAPSRRRRPRWARSRARGLSVATLDDRALRLRRQHVLRQGQMRDAGAGIGRGDGLVDHAGRLRRRGDGLGVERDVAKQQVRLGGLEEVGALHLARHVAGQRQHRRVVAAGLVEPGDQMRAAGPGGAGADAEPAGQLGLAGGGQRRAFFVAHADPFDLAAPHRIGQRIERVADQPEDLLDADLSERRRPEFPRPFWTCSLRLFPMLQTGTRPRRSVNLRHGAPRANYKFVILFHCFRACGGGKSVDIAPEAHRLRRMMQVRVEVPSRKCGGR